MKVYDNCWSITNYVGNLGLKRENLFLDNYDMESRINIVKNYCSSDFTIIIGGCPSTLFWYAPEGIKLSEESLLQALNELEAEVKVKVQKEFDKILNPSSNYARASASEKIRECSFYLEVISTLKWEIDSSRWAA